MVRMRTIEQAYTDLKADDPNSAVSKHYIRQLVITKQIPARKSGKRYLLNFDALEDYLSGDTDEQRI